MQGSAAALYLIKSLCLPSLVMMLEGVYLVLPPDQSNTHLLVQRMILGTKIPNVHLIHNS